MAARFAGTVGGGIASRLACASEAPRDAGTVPALAVDLASASAAVGQPPPGAGAHRSTVTGAAVVRPPMVLLSLNDAARPSGMAGGLCAATVGTSTKTFPTVAGDWAAAAAAPSVATMKSLGREAAAAEAGFPALSVAFAAAARAAEASRPDIVR